ncbi:MAG: hypothetical protein AB8C84_06970 [Oligoflexales bacterium]
MRLAIYLLLIALWSCDAPISSDKIAVVKSGVFQEILTQSQPVTPTQLRADSLAIGNTMISELQDDLVAAGMDLVQVSAITKSATKSLKAGTLAIGLHLTDTNSVVIKKPIDVSALLVSGAIDALDDPDAALADFTLRSNFTKDILDSTIESVTLPGRIDINNLSQLTQNIVQEAVSSLDEAGFAGSSTVSGASAITQGAMASLTRQSGIDENSLVSIAQSMANGAVTAIQNTSVSSDDVGAVAKSLTQGAVTALAASASVSDHQMASMVRGLTKGAVEGIATSGTTDQSAKAVIASSVTAGAIGGLSDSGSRELSLITQAVTEGAISGIQKTGSDNFAEVAQSITTGAISGLSEIQSQSSVSVSSLASSVTAGAIGGLKNSGISAEKMASVASGAFKGAISGLGSLNFRDNDGSSSAGLTEAIGQVTEGAMSSLQGVEVAEGENLAGSLASASMAGLSELKKQVDKENETPVLNLSAAVARVAEGAVKSLEASQKNQTDGSLVLGEQLEALTGGLVKSMQSAGFSEVELSSGAGAIASGAIKGFQESVSTEFVANVMIGTMGNLDDAGMKESDIALAMSNIVGETMAVVGTQVAKNSSQNSSLMIQGIVQGSVRGLNGAQMKDTASVQQAVQGIARGATGSLKKAGVSAENMSAVANSVTKVSIQQLSSVEVAGQVINVKNIQDMASKVARGSMEGFSTTAQDLTDSGATAPSVDDFAGELSKGALEALKDLKQSGSAVDLNGVSSDLAGAILDGAAQSHGSDLGSIRSELTIQIKASVSDSLTANELAVLETNITQKAGKAEALASALSSVDSIVQCSVAYADTLTNEEFQGLVPPDQRAVICEISNVEACPISRDFSAIDVDWYPLSGATNLCEMAITTVNLVTAGEFQFYTLPSHVFDTVTVSWSEADHAAFYTLRLSQTEGCHQNSLIDIDGIDASLRSFELEIPKEAAEGSWYVCLGATTESFSFTPSSPAYQQILLDKSPPDQANLIVSETVFAPEVTVRWGTVTGVASYVLSFSRQTDCSSPEKSWSLSSSSTSQLVKPLAVGVAYTLCLEAIDSSGLATTVAKNVQYQLPTFTILGGATHTYSSLVDLQLQATGSEKMWISNESCTSGGLWQAYANSYNSWELSVSNSVATVYVIFEDSSGSKSDCISRTIIHDNVPPSSSSITLDAGNTHTNSMIIDIDLASFGATKMYITHDSTCVSGGSWEDYQTKKNNWNLLNAEMINTVYVMFEDEAGNDSGCLADIVIHDSVAPTSPMITIAAGIASTNDLDPDLTLSAVDASHMFVTNEAGCSTGGSWEAYDTSKLNWAFKSEDLNTATATVYVKYKDEAGNESGCVSDLIEHDNQGPTGSISINNDAAYTSSLNTTLTLSVTGVSSMYITNTSGCSSGGSWINFSQSLPYTLAQSNEAATVYAKFSDDLGNESNCLSASIIHDNVAPTSESLLISGGNAYTSSALVSLSPFALGANEMYITNNSGCASGGTWTAYANTVASWNLDQMNGSALVYAQFKDYAGNSGPCVSASITHDNIPPSVPGVFIDGVASKDLTESSDFTWSASSDGGSGFSLYEVSIGTSPGGTDIKGWTDVGSVLTVSMTGLSLADGATYYANIRAVDHAGNFSGEVYGDGFTGSSGGIDCSSLSAGVWVGIPGDSDYGTSDFCVMKYEAHNNSGTPGSAAAGIPWVNINQTIAISECASIGANYHLITNEEWMTIAANIAEVDENWSGGTVGSGQLNRGHSDNSPTSRLASSADDNDSCVGTGQTCDSSTWHSQRRTHKLSTGDVIWDIAGNVLEKTSKYEPDNKVNPLANYQEFSITLTDAASWVVKDIIPRNSYKSFWSDSWNSSQGLGKYYASNNTSGGVMERGGQANHGDKAGIFAAFLSSTQTSTSSSSGFRCAAPVSP